MSDVHGQEGNENTETEEVEAAEEAENEEVLDADVEARATEMGWLPKDQFPGKEDDWRPAAEYLRRGEEVLPIVNAQNRKLEQKLAAAEKRERELEANFKQQLAGIERATQIGLERMRKQIVAQYEDKKREAAASGDPEAYDRAAEAERAELKDLDEEAAKAAEASTADQPKTEDQQKAEDKKAFTAFKVENPWLNADPVLAKQTEAHLDHVLEENPNIDMTDALAEAKKRVMNDYPDRFKQVRRKGPMLEGGGRGGGGGGGDGKGVADLPREARVAGERFVKQGLFKDLKEYANDYHAQD